MGFTEQMSRYERRLEATKRAATLHLLFKTARLLNERAIASLPTSTGRRPTPAHMALFPHIELQGGSRITELSAKLGISKQAVGQLVDDLEEMGVVARLEDPDDGRAKRVVFSARGRRSMLDGLIHLRKLERQLAKEVGGDTMRQLRDALLVLHDYLATGD